MDEEVMLTQELVRINSENPPGNEKEVAKFVYDYLQDLKIQSELIEIEENRYDVIADMGKGSGLMFNGHMDTVPIGDVDKWKHDPLGGEIKGGKLYGRGSSDMKSGVACILAAVKKVCKEDFKGRLALTFVADEESGQKGSNYIIRNRKDFLSGVKYGIFGESTGLEVTYAQKGVLHGKVIFTGKAAHGSSPHLGVNAIEKAVRFIDELEKLKVQLKRIKDPDLGSGTINIGKITGGTKVNVVPDYCEVSIDRRLVPGESPKLAVKQFKNALKSAGVSGRMDMPDGRMAIKTDKHSELIELIRKSGFMKLKAISGYTELELYKTDAGIDCVAVGPGAHGQAHVVDEFVSISNLKKAVYLYENLIKKLCM